MLRVKVTVDVTLSTSTEKMALPKSCWTVGLNRSCVSPTAGGRKLGDHFFLN